jgi:hypothetical protein
MFSANTSQVAAGGGALYVEDVMSTFLYAGNAGSQNIVNGVDLSTYGGLVWIKDRTQAASHYLQDTVRGANNILSSNNTNAQSTLALNTVFNTDGFSQNNSFGGFNGVGDNYVSWTFREAPKFFDVVTWTGNSTVRTIAHNLGSVPGCIIVKDLLGGNWFVYHQALGNTKAILLNNADAAGIDPSWNNTTPTSTVFTLGSNSEVNFLGHDYVAYLFAHDAGGFGLTGTDNVISCGSYTGSNSSAVSVNLGYEPQWVMIKRTDSSGSPAWWIGDTMRGLNMQGINRLEAWTSNAESAAYNGINPTATGFVLPYGTVLNDAATSNYIYIAIRRGPMKVPTSGTSVFSPIQAAGSTGTKLTTNFPVDLQIWSLTADGGSSKVATDRLRGVSTNTTTSGVSLYTDLTDAENSASNATRYFDNTGYTIPGNFLGSGYNAIYWNFRRAPSFFDEVCFTGDGTSNRAIPHNLTVAPELIIQKKRSSDGVWPAWCKYYSFASGTAPADRCVGQLDSSLSFNDPLVETQIFSPLPTSTNFYTGSFAALVNANAATYVTFLFATCPNVSKVFTFTGNGTTQTINCGFTGGARFVLLKAASAAGGWYVYDIARGMTVLTDPYLFMNSTAAEVATLGSVITATTGFTVNEAITIGVNTNGVTYIGLAIA